MKSFRSFILESPMMIDLPTEMGGDMSKSNIGKPITGIIHRLGQVPRLLKPKSKGKIGEYTFHHATIQDRPIFGEPQTHHYMFLAKDGNVVGSIKGERIRVETDDEGKKVEHIGISTAVIDPAHRGQDLYAKMLKHFVEKTPHVLYSDIAQSKGSAKSWSGIAKSSDSEGIDFRVHPLLHQSDNIVGTGISKSGELDPRYWIGTPLPSGGYLPAEKMRFSIRRK